MNNNTTTPATPARKIRLAFADKGHTVATLVQDGVVLDAYDIVREEQDGVLGWTCNGWWFDTRKAALEDLASEGWSIPASWLR